MLSVKAFVREMGNVLYLEKSMRGPSGATGLASKPHMHFPWSMKACGSSTIMDDGLRTWMAWRGYRR